MTVSAELHRQAVRMREESTGFRRRAHDARVAIAALRCERERANQGDAPAARIAPCARTGLDHQLGQVSARWVPLSIVRLIPSTSSTRPVKSKGLTRHLSAPEPIARA